MLQGMRRTSSHSLCGDCFSAITTHFV